MMIKSNSPGRCLSQYLSGGGGGSSEFRIMLSQPSLAGVGAGAELGKNKKITRLKCSAWKGFMNFASKKNFKKNFMSKKILCQKKFSKKYFDLKKSFV